MKGEHPGSCKGRKPEDMGGDCIKGKEKLEELQFAWKQGDVIHKNDYYEEEQENK